MKTDLFAIKCIFWHLWLLASGFYHKEGANRNLDYWNTACTFGKEEFVFYQTLDKMHFLRFQASLGSAEECTMHVITIEEKFMKHVFIWDHIEEKCVWNMIRSKLTFLLIFDCRNYANLCFRKKNIEAIICFSRPGKTMIRMFGGLFRKQLEWMYVYNFRPQVEIVREMIKIPKSIIFPKFQRRKIIPKSYQFILFFETNLSKTFEKDLR